LFHLSLRSNWVPRTFAWSDQRESFLLAQTASVLKRSTRTRVVNYTYTAAETTHYYNELWELLQSGAVKPHIYKVYPFTAEGIAAAQTDQASGKTTGKLLIKVED